MKDIKEKLGPGVQRLFSRFRWCFWLNERKPAKTDKNKFSVSIVFENRDGHYPIPDVFWSKKQCTKENKSLGLSESDVRNIIGSAMSYAERHRLDVDRN